MPVPPTSRMPATKMNAIDARDQRNTSKMNASARTSSHSRWLSCGITSARCCPSRFGHRNELIAFGAQAVDDLRQRRDGMAAVAAAIVQQDDVALVGLGVVEHALHDGLHGRRRLAAGFAPIVRIDPRSHNDVSHRLRNRQHLHFARGFRLMIDSVRRPKQRRFHSQAALDQQFREIQFELQLRFSKWYRIPDA